MPAILQISLALLRRNIGVKACEDLADQSACRSRVDVPGIYPGVDDDMFGTCDLIKASLFSSKDHLLPLSPSWNLSLLTMLPFVFYPLLDGSKLLSLDLSSLLDLLRHMPVPLDPLDLRHMAVPLLERIVVLHTLSLSRRLDALPLRGI